MSAAEFCRQFLQLWSQATNPHLQLLKQDPLYAKIDPAQAECFIETAVSRGKQEARWYLEHPQELQGIIDSLKINTLPEAQAQQERYTFALYKKVDQIMIDHTFLAQAQQFIEAQQLSRLLPMTTLTEVVLMHEIFHVLEYRKNLWTVQKQLHYHIGFLKKQARLYSLSEIAAASFVQEFYQLENSPMLLASCMIYCKNPLLAQAIVTASLENQTIHRSY